MYIALISEISHMPGQNIHFEANIQYKSLPRLSIDRAVVGKEVVTRFRHLIWSSDILFESAKLCLSILWTFP